MTEQEHEKSRPSFEQIDRELRRKTVLAESVKAVWGAARTLVVFAAVAMLVSTLWLRVFSVEESSMAPTLTSGELLIIGSAREIERGDIVAFQYGSRVLIKRVIALGGDTVDMDFTGVVTVNGERLLEPYISEQSYGECDIAMPFQVPARQLFVMGDSRASSIDSRTSAIGTVGQNQMVGKVLFRVWPLSKLGRI